MGTVRDILNKKGFEVCSISKEATVLEAATVMNEHKIGSVVVMEGAQVVGIFTERDVLQRVVGEQRDPGTSSVGEVMTCEVACCGLDTSLDEARYAMKTRRIRHLPVVDHDQKLLGLISIGDLNAYHTHNQEQTIFLLEEYVQGRV
jgi:CBS domain-containing protein